MYMWSLIDRLIDLIDRSTRALNQTNLPPSTPQTTTQEREREQRLHARMDTLLAATAPHTTLKLVGHLFDSGLINQVLDVVEARGGSFRIR